MLKEITRREYLDKRKKLSQGEIQVSTGQIIKNFSATGILNKQYLLSYYPLKEQNEFNVSVAENELRKNSPDLKTAWPKIGIDGITMEAMPVDSHTLFVKNKHNILEPLDVDAVNPETLDIIFVPLIAFDLKGFRVGYGKGYYDRYLSRCSPAATKIGFSFFEAVDRLDDIHEFDVPLDFCISPTRVYEF